MDNLTPVPPQVPDMGKPIEPVHMSATCSTLLRSSSMP